MNFRRPSFRNADSRWALWVFAAALLLKSVMPMLASASAQAQGKTLVEVCTVYGVSLVPLDGSGTGVAPDQAAHDSSAPDRSAGHSAAHADPHCALSALMALAAPQPPALDVPAAAQVGASPLLAHPSPQAPDACATWVARLKHGPPTFS
ncbi:hypothetical protein BH11PSE8_BH11PSE8_14500 [soil metagenome]